MSERGGTYSLFSVVVIMVCSFNVLPPDMWFIYGAGFSEHRKNTGKRRSRQGKADMEETAKKDRRRKNSCVRIKKESRAKICSALCGLSENFFPFTAQAFSGRLLSQKRKRKGKKRRKRLGSGRGEAGNWRESGQEGGVLTFLLR